MLIQTSKGSGYVEVVVVQVEEASKKKTFVRYLRVRTAMSVTPLVKSASTVEM